MGEELRRAYRVALKAALANLGNVAEETSRAYITLKSYRSGKREVTADAARDLVEYLQKRSTQLQEAADELQRAIDKEIGDA